MIYKNYEIRIKEIKEKFVEYCFLYDIYKNNKLIASDFISEHSAKCYITSKLNKE